jgi:hypothetical protein
MSRGRKTFARDSTCGPTSRSAGRDATAAVCLNTVSRAICRVKPSGRHGPQRRNTTPWRSSDHSRILAAELRRAFVADPKRGRLDIRRIRYDQSARFQQTKLLLILQRPHGGYRLELPGNAEGLICATEASSSIRANGGRSALFVNGGSPSVPKACLI